MMIEFGCAHCGAAIRARVDLAGRSGKYRSCGRKIVVPSPPAPKEESDDVYQVATAADASMQADAEGAGPLSRPRVLTKPGRACPPPAA